MATDGALVRILLVGEPKGAARVRPMLEPEGATQFRVTHVADLELAAQRLSISKMDIVVLDLGPERQQGRAFIQAARAAAPDMPMVILSESEDEALALEALRQGVQDFLAIESLDRAVLTRTLRYSIERHRLQKKLQSLSLIDDLTGLNNRRGFLALAEQHLRMIRRKGAALLVYMDLDDLKVINDNHGHLEGNRALIVTANALRACFRQSDILARLGGDEFCVLMTDAGKDSAQQVRKRLQQRMDFINAMSTWRFRLALSIGIAEVPAVHQPSLDDLIKVADTCMYEEKRNKQLRGSAIPVLKQTTSV